MEKFKLTVVRNTLVKIVTTVSIFVFVKNKSDVGIYTIIMVFGIIVSQVVLWPYLYKEIHFVKRNGKSEKSYKTKFIFVPYSYCGKSI